MVWRKEVMSAYASAHAGEMNGEYEKSLMSMSHGVERPLPAWSMNVRVVGVRSGATSTLFVRSASISTHAWRWPS